MGGGGGGGGGGGFHYKGFTRMCALIGYGFQASLLLNRVCISVLFILNRVSL